VQQRLPSLLPVPIAFAHRGARAHAPDNTIEAFTLALRLGATGLETDAWVTADGVVVLDHDGEVGSRFRRRPISTVDRSDLPPHIPTLDDLVRECGTDYHLSIDLKDPRSGIPVLDVLSRRSPDLVARTWLCHPDQQLLVDLRDVDPRVKLLQSTRLAKIRESAERRAAALAEARLDGINLHHTDWNGGLVSLFHRFGLVAFGWDLQYEHLLRPALRMGLDAVYSDHVDVMIDAYRIEIGAPERP
jgi:glycerophosphoryl diester phosphodiesterase